MGRALYSSCYMKSSIVDDATRVIQITRLGRFIFTVDNMMRFKVPSAFISSFLLERYPHAGNARIYQRRRLAGRIQL